jgi:hypothetical protein
MPLHPFISVSPRLWPQTRGTRNKLAHSYALRLLILRMEDGGGLWPRVTVMAQNSGR